MNTSSQAIKDAAQLLKNSKHAISLTGAGVSTESGIPDFRSKNGLWSRFPPSEYGTISAFKNDPRKVWKMLRELIGIANAKPNSGHQAMAHLEEQGLLKCVITQNIDRLHQKAGSKNIIEFHGSIDSFKCLNCQSQYPLTYVNDHPLPPQCPACLNLLKPDIVFFDEQIPDSALTMTQEHVSKADLLIVAGTSCQVAPASYIPSEVYSRGGKIIEINLDPALGHMSDITLTGSFAKIMKNLSKDTTNM